MSSKYLFAAGMLLGTTLLAFAAVLPEATRKAPLLAAQPTPYSADHSRIPYAPEELYPQF